MNSEEFTEDVTSDYDHSSRLELKRVLLSSAGTNHGHPAAAETSAAGRSGSGGSKLQTVPLSPGGGANQAAHGRPPPALWPGDVIRSSCQKSRDVLR